MKLLRLFMTWVVLISGLSFGSSALADEVNDIINRGVLRVGIQTQGIPLSFIDKNGKRTGLTVEIAEMIAEDLGVKIEFQDYDFKGLIPALLAGKVDLVAADVAPTPARASQLLFSAPIFFQDAVAMTRNDATFKNWEELNKEGVTIGATQGSTYIGTIKAQIPNATIKEFPGGTAAAAQALATGRLDAVVSDDVTIAVFLTDYNNLKRLDGVIRRSPLSFPVRPDAFHLKAWLDNYVQWITYDGRLQKKIHYWWETSDWAKDHK